MSWLRSFDRRSWDSSADVALPRQMISRNARAFASLAHCRVSMRSEQTRTSALSRAISFGRRTSALDASLLPAHTPAPDTQLEYEELVLAVHRASLTLQQDLRAVVIGLLRGDSSAEIATALNISPVTVRTRLMQVRAILRPELAAYLDVPAYRPTNSVDKVSHSAATGHG
jgi:DNA-directed RNA polymerase specialized sigma24 family protein